MTKIVFTGQESFGDGVRKRLWKIARWYVLGAIGLAIASQIIYAILK